MGNGFDHRLESNLGTGTAVHHQFPFRGSCTGHVQIEPESPPQLLPIWRWTSAARSGQIASRPRPDLNDANQFFLGCIGGSGHRAQSRQNAES